MANEQNLVSLQSRTENEKREIAKRGGKASGVARRQKKKLKELTQVFMQMKPANEKDVKKLIKAGLKDEEITNQAYMMYKIYEAATKKCNMRAAEFLRDMIGENPYLEMKEKLAREGKGKGMTNMAIPVVLVDDVNE